MEASTQVIFYQTGNFIDSFGKQNVKGRQTHNIMITQNNIISNENYLKAFFNQSLSNEKLKLR